MDSSISILTALTAQVFERRYFLEKISRAQLEKVLEDSKHGFSKSMIGGEVISDYSTSLALYQQILHYCIDNIESLYNQYGFSHNLNYGKIAEIVIENELIKR